LLVDDLCLVEADDGLGQRIVIGVAAGTDRADCAGVGEALGVANCEVLDATVGVINQTLEAREPLDQIAISRASSASSARRVVDTFQPTMYRLNTSVTKAV